MKRFLSCFLSLIIAINAFAISGAISYAAEGVYSTTKTARTVTLGETFNGTFTKNDTNDFNKFTINESGRVSLILKGNVYYSDKSGASFHCEILNNKGEEIQDIAISYNDNLGYSYQEYKIDLTAGTYFIKPYTYSNITGSYEITSNFVSSNESFYENETVDNNLIGTANSISLNTIYNGQIALNDEIDFYKFVVKSGTYNIYIKADFCGYEYVNHASACYEIYTPTGEEVYSNRFYYNDDYGYASGTSAVSLNSGTYYLKIYSSYSSHTGNYIFSVNTQNKKSTIKKPATPSLKSVKAVKKGHKIKVIWSKVSNASGYQICWYKDSKCKKTAAQKIITNANTTKYSGKGFTKGKKYYVRVRSYKIVNGKKVYSKWSKVKSVKTK